MDKMYIEIHLIYIRKIKQNSLYTYSEKKKYKNHKILSLIISILLLYYLNVTSQKFLIRKLNYSSFPKNYLEKKETITIHSIVRNLTRFRSNPPTKKSPKVNLIPPPKDRE